ncbi:hypothetical protein A1O1_02700 [Capronia coronata CBS 617.96]|uniref:Gem-associated protein 5 TPR domain-containing protein n=1 Tax=Capronia coronata CBS 617.96 TaxID=1182541 RepID=W9YYE1_9EURO|nr:uncharacterized protein A1O1_02700 [Capronia coronata CBS 617.96]EXJ94306.1 hypothetical protein A1O1_02700 [Capronia coronata CBS 617.96]
MSGTAGVSRQWSVSNKLRGAAHPMGPDVRSRAEDMPFEPCASTASLVLFAQGSTILCLHHDTLAVERRFEKHSKDIQLIAADSVSETGTGRLVVSYDVAQTAIVWDLLTGEQLSRFVSYETLKVAHWMRNGNIVFGNAKGEVILFEPPTSDHISARTIFDPITAIAPSQDCKTYAIGYNNGSILLAALQPSFTILHTLTTSRAPSPIASLTWHASSSKQKSDMLATQTADGDLRVWSVSKPPTAEAPRVIRALKRSDTFVPGRNWITWSKNGRIVQFSEGKTCAWDVRTKHVTSAPIPTVDGVRGIAAHGPTGTLFTLGPDYTVQQYDVERAVMVANVRHMPITIPPTPPEEGRGPMWTTPQSEEDLASAPAHTRRDLRANEVGRHEWKDTHVPSPQSTKAGSQNTGLKLGGSDMVSPAGRTEYTTTTFDTGVQSQSTLNQPVQSFNQGYQQQSPVTAKSTKKGSRLRQEVVMSPEEQPVVDLLPFTRARLHDVPYRQPASMDDALLTPHDLRRQMLKVVFGWEEDIQDLIRDELSRHANGSQNAIFLAKWLDEDPDYLAEILGSTGLTSNLDWMLLALGTISNQVGAKKITQVFIEKLLSKGDVHAAATLLLALGDRSDAIEVYVTRNQYMEAVLLTCLVTPDDWQRQSYLVRRWGEHVVENSQQALAIRCFSCTGVEPSDPWTSPQAQIATQSLLQPVLSPAMPQVEPLQPLQYPAIFHKTLERRRTLDTPTPVAMPPPPLLPAQPPPHAPYRTATAQGTSAAPQTAALKLVTSFGSQSSNTFKFPGLKPDDRTPTVGAAVTPIAESAIDRSALSPGGLGSYRLNNTRSINSALSGKTATPGGFQPSRLPSIGETPVDVEAPQFPSAIPPRSFSVPVELAATKPGDNDGLTTSINHTSQVGKQGLMLLTSARYEPVATPIGETPQTALGPHTAVRFPDSTSRVAARDAGEMDVSRVRTGSRSRKPDGLSIQTSVNEVKARQESLPANSYAESIGRPTTTGSYTNTQLETSIDLTSAPTTGQSHRSVKSPMVTARSMDPFISSLEQAQYLGKHSRARGYSSNSKNSREDLSDRKKGRATNADEGSGRDARRTIPAAKRSPSSPIPMSPEDVRMYSTSVESFESMYGSNLSGMDRTSTPASISKLSRHGSQSTTTGTKHRHRSHSRRTGTRSKTGSRGTSRQHSPDITLISPRGRSSSRQENPGHRSPSSPRPMIPSEEDRRSRFDEGSAMRLVSLDRHRLQRSTSRQPERGTSARQDPSPDRRRPRTRSRSRRAEEASLYRRRSRSEGKKRRRRPSEVTSERSARGNMNLMPETLSQEDAESSSHPQFSTSRSRREFAAERLEARRQSLARRPSAPNVLLPSQLAYHSKSASTGNAPPLARAYTDDSSTRALGHEQQTGVDMSWIIAAKDRSGTPRTMPEAAIIPEGEPGFATTTVELLASDVYRPPTRDVPSRPGSARAAASVEVLSHMPKHPAYDSRIGNSRASSKGPEGRGSSRSRGTSKDRTRASPRDAPPMSVGPAEGVSYTGSPPQQHPPILPELQHLAAPPPPPPPPKLPMLLNTLSLSNLRAFEAEAVDVPLPMSADPGGLSEAPYSGRSLSAASMSTGHRRGRSGNETSGGPNQLLGKIRNLAGRVRSPSRGRRGDDNQAMSPRSNTDQIAPYESILSAMT